MLLAAAAASEPGMMRLPGGAFTMGSDKGLPDERPAHRVSLKAFWIDRRPVTNAEFAAFLQRNGGTSNARGQNLFDWDDRDARLRQRDGRWQADAGFEQHPVIEANWYGARDASLHMARRDRVARGPGRALQH